MVGRGSLAAAAAATANARSRAAAARYVIGYQVVKAADTVLELLRPGLCVLLLLLDQPVGTAYQTG